eukprot:CAMPEP_0206517522 /NCGR_PEP_ID=MMETSP0324_2-20121206/64028_1 /ASSEMBLY_ACC=CAM_ASM_000836 /TAXON_ID=2866 /ORGANISM="Crypthecodinium cohnii, Strain Seligo" /LENGTH=150 /DNA_ID=CAMNT_0054010693 /DNA_START=974 /DNA_END=1426 /DNA_ORIENTATION=-
MVSPSVTRQVSTNCLLGSVFEKDDLHWACFPSAATADPAAPPDSASPELELEEASVLFRPPLLESAAGDNGPNSPVGNDLERSMSEVSPAVGSRVILQMSPKVRERLSGWSQTNEDQATGGCVLDLPARLWASRKTGEGGCECENSWKVA